METIYKYPLILGADDKIIIEMPNGAKILTVQMQKSEPFIWALVNPDEHKVERYFRLYGTGMEVAPGFLYYVGTFQMLKGSLVFHLFELP